MFVFVYRWLVIVNLFGCVIPLVEVSANIQRLQTVTFMFYTETVGTFNQVESQIPLKTISATIMKCISR